MSRRVALDTSAYSHFRTGHAELETTLAKAETIYLPAIVVGELEGAFALGARRKDNLARLHEFLDEPFVSTLPVTLDVARRYGDIFSDLKKRGKPVPTNDLWIAATVMEAGVHLLTFDGDFDRILGLDRTIFTVG